MAKRTRYTPEFKAEVVLEALSGESSQKDQTSADAAARIAHLEQLVGRLTVALDIEKKVPRPG